MERPASYNFKKRKVFIFLFIILVFLLTGGLVKFLWNEILPDVIGVKTITYPQALGILALCKILFGSFGFGGKNRRPPFIQNKEREGMISRTEEERQQFRAEWKKRTL
jgi:hypothetical protein